MFAPLESCESLAAAETERLPAEAVIPDERLTTSPAGTRPF
jgi:hypothetical protein